MLLGIWAVKGDRYCYLFVVAGSREQAIELYRDTPGIPGKDGTPGYYFLEVERNSIREDNTEAVWLGQSAGWLVPGTLLTMEQVLDQLPCEVNEVPPGSLAQGIGGSP